MPATASSARRVVERAVGEERERDERDDAEDEATVVGRDLSDFHTATAASTKRIGVINPPGPPKKSPSCRMPRGAPTFGRRETVLLPDRETRGRREQKCLTQENKRNYRR
jgi:hypothetical protein